MKAGRLGVTEYGCVEQSVASVRYVVLQFDGELDSLLRDAHRNVVTWSVRRLWFTAIRPSS